MGLLGRTMGRSFKSPGKFDIAAGVGFGALDFYSSKKEGKSDTAAMGSAALNVAAYTIFPQVGWAMTAFDLAKMSQGMFEKYLDMKNSNQYGKFYGAFGQSFVDSANKATMRQRAISHIQNSRQNARSVLGKEARYLNQNWREDRY